MITKQQNGCVSSWLIIVNVTGRVERMYSQQILLHQGCHQYQGYPAERPNTTSNQRLIHIHLHTVQHRATQGREATFRLGTYYPVFCLACIKTHICTRVNCECIRANMWAQLDRVCVICSSCVHCVGFPAVVGETVCSLGRGGAV